MSLFSAQAFCATVQTTWYLNQGLNTELDSLSFGYLAINETDTFSSKNAILRLNVGDTLSLKLHNQTGTDQSFYLNPFQGFLLASGDSIEITQAFSAEGIFLLYSDLNFPDYRNAGASAMIVVSSRLHASFYWNIQEHESTKSDSVLNGHSVNWMSYYPNAFFINGTAKPKINLDAEARVTGQVGDTIYIYIANSGMAAHSMHFHGYHAKIVYDNMNAHYVGRDKDTFPFLSQETMILELVPHQPGEYPVHDHNLVAVSGNGIYPNGMFLTMFIQ